MYKIVMVMDNKMTPNKIAECMSISYKNTYALILS